MKAFHLLIFCLLFMGVLCVRGTDAVSESVLEIDEVPVVKGSVTASSLNVRIYPDANSTVVATLPRGAEVEVLSEDGDWLAIRIPDTAEMWISAQFVGKDNMIEENSPLRAGPSVAYESYGRAGGETVTVLERAKENKWLRISPLKQFPVYASTDYVKIPGMKSGNGNGNGSNGQKNSGQPSAEHSFLRGYEKHVYIEGTVIPLESDEMPDATHALSVLVNGSWYPLAYIKAKTINLKLWENRSVRITGIQRWMENKTRPLIDVTEIAPAWHPPN